MYCKVTIEYDDGCTKGAGMSQLGVPYVKDQDDYDRGFSGSDISDKEHLILACGYHVDNLVDYEEDISV
jgi:hypothetical protein